MNKVRTNYVFPRLPPESEYLGVSDRAEVIVIAGRTVSVDIRVAASTLFHIALAYAEHFKRRMNKEDTRVTAFILSRGEFFTSKPNVHQANYPRTSKRFS